MIRGEDQQEQQNQVVVTMHTTTTSSSSSSNSNNSATISTNSPNKSPRSRNKSTITTTSSTSRTSSTSSKIHQSARMLEAQNHFRQVVKQELQVLLQEGIEREIAVKQLLHRIVKSTDEPEQKDVERVMKQFQMNQEDAVRALIVKQEIGRLKGQGMDAFAAIEALTRKMQRLPLLSTSTSSTSSTLEKTVDTIVVEEEQTKETEEQETASSSSATLDSTTIETSESTSQQMAGSICVKVESVATIEEAEEEEEEAEEAEEVQLSVDTEKKTDTKKKDQETSMYLSSLSLCQRIGKVSISSSSSNNTNPSPNGSSTSKRTRKRRTFGTDAIVLSDSTSSTSSSSTASTITTTTSSSSTSSTTALMLPSTKKQRICLDVVQEGDNFLSVMSRKAAVLGNSSSNHSTPTSFSINSPTVSSSRGHKRTRGALHSGVDVVDIVATNVIADLRGVSELELAPHALKRHRS